VSGGLLWVRALAAEGRAAEAMRAAASYRRRLAAETGLDPGPELDALEREVASGALAGPATRGGRPARPTGPLVGRERDRAELHRLLAQHAVVTVTGPGGVGKTRLTADVAADLGDQGRDVAVVMLAAVPDPARVPDAVASALGLRTAGRTTPEAVAEALAGRSLLVVLDNCEHVTAVCCDLVSAVRTRARPASPSSPPPAERCTWPVSSCCACSRSRCPGRDVPSVTWCASPASRRSCSTRDAWAATST
jgi:AAA domain-containing protein/transcriptional activator